MATVIYLYESCSLFKIFTSQVSHLCDLSDCFIHISKLGISILRVKMEYFHLSKNWSCLDDFRWVFNLKTCHKSWWNGFRNIVYKEQVTCLGKMNAFMYHSLQNLHGTLRCYCIFSTKVHVQSCVCGYRCTYKAACTIAGSCCLDIWKKKYNSNKRKISSSFICLPLLETRVH